MRQLLTGSVALSLTGGVLGLAAVAVVLRGAPALMPVDVARLDEVGIDEVTVVFTVGLSVLVGLLSGVVPALQWSQLDLVRTLNEGSAQSAGGFRLLRSNWSRAVLVTAQVALALVLLVGTGLLLRSFRGGAADDRDRGTSLLRGLRRVFRRARLAPRCPRALRAAQLHGGVTPGRDWHSQGVGGPARRHSRAGGEVGRRARGRRRRGRLGRRGRLEPRSGEPAAWRLQRRPPGVRDRTARARGGGPGRLLAPRAAGDAGRSD